MALKDSVNYLSFILFPLFILVVKPRTLRKWNEIISFLKYFAGYLHVDVIRK